MFNVQPSWEDVEDDKGQTRKLDLHGKAPPMPVLSASLGLGGRDTVGHSTVPQSAGCDPRSGDICPTGRAGVKLRDPSRMAHVTCDREAGVHSRGPVPEATAVSPGIRSYPV